MNKFTRCILMLLLLTACSTVESPKNTFACSELDWYEIGRSDGVQGHDSMAYKGKQENCSGFSNLDHEKYVNGWYSGVDLFCTPQQGFAYGRSGKKYLDICPSSKETAFLEAYRKGLKVYLYEKDNQKITYELHKMTDEAQAVAPEKAPLLVKKMTQLETRLELNKALIAEIQKEMDSATAKTATF